MTTKSMIESAWAEDMEFLYHFDPTLEKLQGVLKKIKLKMINCVQSSITKFGDIYIYMCVFVFKW